MNVNIHRHPISGRVVAGDRLVPGDVIRADDVYDSTSGGWAFSPCVGVTIEEGNETYWVRPTKAQVADLKAAEERRLIGLARKRKMTKEEEDIQWRSFTFGNATIDNPLVTREMVNAAADDIKKSRK